jgi:hypothetical protein
VSGLWLGTPLDLILLANCSSSLEVCWPDANPRSART